MVPIEYQIVRNLQSALLAITVAGGYHYGVGATAVKLDANTDIEALIGDQALRPFMVLEVLPEKWTYSPANRISLVMPVTVHWVSEATELTDDARLLTYFNGVADVERAIAKDIARGGLAIDTRVVRRTLDRVIDGAQVWAIVETEIRTHRIYGQPDS